MRNLLAAMLLLELTPTRVLAVNVAPSSRTAMRSEPYAFDLGPAGTVVATKLREQRYAVTEKVQDVRGTSPTVAVLTCRDSLDDGYGYWFTCSYGIINGCTVEVYEYTPVGEAAGDTSYDRLIRNEGFTPIQVYKSYLVDHGFGIGLYASKIGAHFSGGKTIVHNGACEGQTYQPTAWPGAQVKLGYSACPLMSTVVSDANTLPARMNGESGKTKRAIVNARAGLSIQCAGHENTVLAPCIQEIHPANGTAVLGSVSGWVIEGGNGHAVLSSPPHFHPAPGRFSVGAGRSADRDGSAVLLWSLHPSALQDRSDG